MGKKENYSLPEACQELAKSLNAKLEAYAEQIKSLRLRELKKSEHGTCPLCGNIDSPEFCICLSKAEKLQKDDAYATPGNDMPVNETLGQSEEAGKKKPLMCAESGKHMSKMGRNGECMYCGQLETAEGIKETKKNAFAGYAPQIPGLMQSEKKSVKLPMAKEELGFDKLKNKLAHKKGVSDPAALAAAIGRKKLGQKEMTRRAVAAKSETGLKRAQESMKKSEGFLGDCALCGKPEHKNTCKV